MIFWDLFFAFYLVGAMVSSGFSVRFHVETHIEDKEANGPSGALITTLLTAVVTIPQHLLIATSSWIYVGYFLAADAYQKKHLLIEIRNKLRPLNEDSKEAN